MISDQEERMRRSNANQLIEHSVDGAMRAMIVGVGLNLKFWPFSFDHFLRITIATLSRDQAKPPFEKFYGMKEDLTRFRTSGYRVWVQHLGRRRVKLQTS
jgi:hypothetical protein